MKTCECGKIWPDDTETCSCGAALPGDGDRLGDLMMAGHRDADDDADGGRARAGVAQAEHGPARANAGDGVAAAGGSAEAQERDLTADELAEIARSHRFVIGMIGYPESGKTWFLNRLKRRYERNQSSASEGEPSTLGKVAYEVRLPAAKNFETVSRTNVTSEHIIIRLQSAEASAAVPAAAETAANDARRSFSIIDIPGERFRTAMEADFLTEEAVGLLDAIEVCHALILLLPAEKLFAAGASEDIRRQKMLAQRKLTKRDPPADEQVGAIPADMGSANLKLELAEINRKLATAARRDKRAARRDGGAAPLPDPVLLNRRAELEQDIANRQAWRRAEDALEIEEFTGNITRLRVVLSMLRTGDLGRARHVMRMSNSEYAEAAGAVRLADAPLIYVAMSKADAILPRIEDRLEQRKRGGKARVPTRELELHPDLTMDPDQIDLYPAKAIRQTHPDIYAGVQNNFPWYKFDFLTAFRGQQEEGKDSDQISYRAPAWGVEAVIEWIVWAQKYARATGRTGSESRGRRIFRALFLAYRMEAEVARVATGSPPPRSIWRKAVVRLLSPTMRWPRAKAVQVGLGVGIGAFFLAAYLFGAGSALRSYEDTGAYAFAAPDRLPIELRRMAIDHPRMATGYLDEPAQPWNGIPWGHRMFEVSDPRARAMLRSALDDIRALPPGTVRRGAGQELIDRLDLAQRQISSRNAFAHRAVVPYHVAYLEFRMGRPDEAERSVREAIALMDAAVPETDIQRSRLIGARVAARVLLARLLIDRQQYAEAAQMLDEQRSVVTAQRRLLRAAEVRHEFFAFDPRKTPAVLDTATIWTQLAAARIRLHHASGGSGEAAEASAAQLAELVASVPRAARTELARHPSLAANLQIAAVRIGAPHSVVAGFSSAARAPAGTPHAADRETERTAEWALRISGQQNEQCARGDVWCVTQSWRDAFSQGEAGWIRQTRAEYGEGADRFNAADLDYLDQWRSDVLAAHRRETADRAALVAGYGDMFSGISYLGRLLDSAPFGRFFGILLPILLFGGLARLAWLTWRSRRAFRQLQDARHYRDRKAWEAEQEKRALPPATASP